MLLLTGFANKLPRLSYCSRRGGDRISLGRLVACSCTTEMSTDVVVAEEVAVKSTKDGFDIPCKIWQAKDRPIRAAAFYIHGGAFASGDRDSHPKMIRALAQDLGIAVITASFRCGAVAPHRTGTTLRDLEDVARCFRKRVAATSTGILPFGVIGSSSGGYYALELATAAKELRFDFCIPICPVSHPGWRAAYLRDCVSGRAASNPSCGHHCHTPEKGREMLDRQLSYWETDEAMEEAGELLRWNRIAANRVPPPPTLLVVGAADKNVPMHVHRLVQAWATRTIVVGGAGHELQDEPPIDNDDFKNFLRDIERFLAIVSSRNNRSSSTTGDDSL